MSAPSSARGSIRRTTEWLLLAALVVTAGCDYACRVERRAGCSGVDAARVEKALSGDPAVHLSREESGIASDELHLACDREGVVANVMLTRSPDRIRVTVLSLNRPPTAKELPVWTESVEDLCARMSAACPEIGEWSNEDDLSPPRFGVLIIVVAVAGVVVPAWAITAVVWIYLRQRKPRDTSRA